MPSRSSLQAQIRKVEKRLRSLASQRRKQVDALRAKAADTALHWIMANKSRVSSFRKSVKGTPAEKALDALLKLLRSEARTGKKTARKKTSRKKTARRKATSRSRPKRPSTPRIEPPTLPPM